MSEKARRYSRKREAIREVLMGTTSHPTAEWIYSQLKPEIPDLSLATVYRNLGEMKQNGEVQSVAFWGGKERFDGNVKKHSHFVCEECGRIDDFHFVPHNTGLDESAQKHYDGRVEFHTLVFHGTCGECLKKVSNA